MYRSFEWNRASPLGRDLVNMTSVFSQTISSAEELAAQLAGERQRKVRLNVVACVLPCAAHPPAIVTAISASPIGRGGDNKVQVD